MVFSVCYCGYCKSRDAPRIGSPHGPVPASSRGIRRSFFPDRLPFPRLIASITRRPLDISLSAFSISPLQDCIAPFRPISPRSPAAISLLPTCISRRTLLKVDVDQFHGIEYSEWPVRIAEVAMWLMDHQMNNAAAEVFGQSFDKLPLRASPHIVQANALRIDWNDVLPAAQCTYILGNPPFIGAKYQTNEQRADMEAVAGSMDNYGLLDYVTGWYVKAAEYIRGTPIVVGFVSTNSITQGEQVAPLWRPLIDRFQISIHFAHRSFPWISEARGRAHVTVVVIGFAAFPAGAKLIYDYSDPDRPTVATAANINPYLADGPNVTVANRSTPLSTVGELAIGNKPIDDGQYLFTPQEKAGFIAAEPDSEKWFRRWIGAEEYIHAIERWCLWLGNRSPGELRKMPKVMQRVEAVRAYRLASRSVPTQRLAATPTRFHVENIPTSDYLVIPEVSSERRNFIPIGFLGPGVLCSNKLRILPDASPYDFGVLSSSMHMAWVRTVTGRLETRIQYSVKLVYNNFPWPNPTPEQRAKVEEKARAVLAAREPHLPPAGMSTLADLYDPLTMPAPLAKAHTELDRAVERCYRKDAFTSDRERVEHLFRLYEQLSTPLLPASPKPRTRKSPEPAVPTNPSRARAPIIPPATAASEAEPQP
jgi:hypothetical protein